MMSPFSRDLWMATRRLAELSHQLGFFGLVLALCVFVGGEVTGLPPALAVSSVWVSFILSILWGSHHLFQEEYRTGQLDQVAVAGQNLSTFLGQRWAAYGIIQGALYGPLLPILAYVAGVEPPTIGALLTEILLTLPGITCLAVLVGVLTLGLRQGGGLLFPLLMLPLLLPLVIFAQLYSQGEKASLWAICALTTLLGGLLWSLGAAALRDALEDR